MSWLSKALNPGNLINPAKAVSNIRGDVSKAWDTLQPVVKGAGDQIGRDFNQIGRGQLPSGPNFRQATDQIGRDVGASLQGVRQGVDAGARDTRELAANAKPYLQQQMGAIRAGNLPVSPGMSAVMPRGMAPGGMVPGMGPGGPGGPGAPPMGAKGRGMPQAPTMPGMSPGGGMMPQQFGPPGSPQATQGPPPPGGKKAQAAAQNPQLAQAAAQNPQVAQAFAQNPQMNQQMNQAAMLRNMGTMAR